MMITEARRRRLCGIGGTLVAVLLSLVPNRAIATGSIDVQVERPDIKTTGPNYVPIVVTVTDAATKGPPKENYTVAVFASNAQGEKSDNYECGNRAYNSGGTPGIYDCTVIVDHGGRWTMNGVVSSIPRGARTQKEAQQRAVIVGRGSVDLDVDAPALRGYTPDKYAPKGRAFDVVLLQAHSVFAVLWAILMLPMIGLAFPGIRRMVAAAVVHRLEDHLKVLTRVVVGLVVATVATGVWLMLYKAGYKPPFSADKIRSVFRLPYGKPYFLTLWLKITTYVVMVLFTVPVIREAHRRSRLTSEDAAPSLPLAQRSRAGVWGTPATSGAGTTARSATIVLDRPATEEERARQSAAVRGGGVLPRLGALLVPVGVSVILVCVTLLKYFHELIEASGALLRK